METKYAMVVLNRHNEGCPHFGTKHAVKVDYTGDKLCPDCGISIEDGNFVSIRMVGRDERRLASGWTRRPIADMVDLRKQVSDSRMGQIQRGPGRGVDMRDVENQQFQRGIDDNYADVSKKGWEKAYEEERGDF